jgi:hypothetical protein
MTLPPPDSLSGKTYADLIEVVRMLIGEVTRLRAENEKVTGAFAQVARPFGSGRSSQRFEGRRDLHSLSAVHVGTRPRSVFPFR